MKIGKKEKWWVVMGWALLLLGLAVSETVLPSMEIIENLMSPKTAAVFYYPWWYKGLAFLFKPRVSYLVLVVISGLLGGWWLLTDKEEDEVIKWYFLPFIAWLTFLFPLSLIGVLLIDWGRVKGKNWLGWLGAVVSFPGAVLLGVYAVDNKKKLSILLSLIMIVIVGQGSYKSGNLAEYQPANIAEQINIQASSELTATGEMLLPWKIKRLAFNKPFVGAYQVGREVLSAYDPEAWFFSHNMQQLQTASEHLTDKHLLATMDWVGAVLLLLSILAIGKKGQAEKFMPLLALGGLVLFEGKGNWRHWWTVGIPIFYQLFVNGWREVKLSKAVKYSLIGLIGLSVLSRSFELVARPMVWQNNRVLAYKFISQELIEREEKVKVSGQLGSAEEMIGFWSSKEAKENEFGQLPSREKGWPAGLYIGLEGELREDKNSEVLASYILRDEVVTKAGKVVKVIKVKEDETE